MTLKARITAIDRFVKGLKEDDLWNDIGSSAILTAWSNLAGALTPLVGAAPTNNGFLATDYDRGIGIAGDASSYINSNRASNADANDDAHIAVYASSAASVTGVKMYAGGYDVDSASYRRDMYRLADDFSFRDGGEKTVAGAGDSVGLIGMSRNTSTEFSARVAAATVSHTCSPHSASTEPTFIFGRNVAGAVHPASITDATLSFYSIGSATDLALLDARVSTLMADLRAIEETGFDRDALAYIRAVEAADGAYLETSVKIAINNLVSGLKADSLWDAIGASCLLCGPRTLAGALVPLRGDAPTGVGFVSGDYYRDTGLKGDGTSYLDSNRANNADPRNDFHISAYATAGATGATYFLGAQHATSSYKGIGYAIWSRSAGATASSVPSSTGLYAVTRDSDSAIKYIKPPSGVVSTSIASVAAAPYATNDYAFALSDSAGSPIGITDAKLAFYSIGTSLDLAKLDSHISSYVTAIGAAI